MSVARITPKTPGSTTFISWNVKEIGNPIKGSRIFAHLKSFNPDIVFLQETHLKVDQHSKRKYEWLGQYFHSKFNYKANCVAHCGAGQYLWP